MFLYRYASVILCSVGEVFIFEHGCHISALEQILSSYVLLACTNAIIINMVTLGLFSEM